jgi:hypothetical protein
VLLLLQVSVKRFRRNSRSAAKSVLGKPGRELRRSAALVETFSGAMLDRDVQQKVREIQRDLTWIRRRIALLESAQRMTHAEVQQVTYTPSLGPQPPRVWLHVGADLGRIEDDALRRFRRLRRRVKRLEREVDIRLRTYQIESGPAT